MIPLPEPESEPEVQPITPGFAVLLTFVVAFSQVFLILMLGSLGFGMGPASLGIATILAFGFSFRLAVPRIPTPPSVHLGFVRPAPVAWWAALFLASSVLLTSEVDNIAKQIWPLPDKLVPVEPPEGVAYQLGLALVLVVVLPAAQEILFRGLLQPAMVRLWGSGRGIAFISALNALAFGLLNPWAFAPTFTSSLVLGILRQSSSSLLPCLLLHALFGGATLLATYEFFRIPGFDDTSAPHTPMEWLGTAALLCGIGLGLCRAAATPRGPTLPTELPHHDS